MYSFRILSNVVTPHIHLHILIPTTFIFIFSSFINLLTLKSIHHRWYASLVIIYPFYYSWNICTTQSTCWTPTLFTNVRDTDIMISVDSVVLDVYVCTYVRTTTVICLTEYSGIQLIAQAHTSVIMLPFETC